MLPAAKEQRAKNLNLKLTHLGGPAPGGEPLLFLGSLAGGKANIWISRERLLCEVNG